MHAIAPPLRLNEGHDYNSALIKINDDLRSDCVTLRPPLTNFYSWSKSAKFGLILAFKAFHFRTKAMYLKPERALEAPLEVLSLPQI